MRNCFFQTKATGIPEVLSGKVFSRIPKIQIMFKKFSEKITVPLILFTLLLSAISCSQQEKLQSKTVIVENRDTIVTFDPATKEEKMQIVVRYDTVEVKQKKQ